MQRSDRFQLHRAHDQKGRYNRAERDTRFEHPRQLPRIEKDRLTPSFLDGGNNIEGREKLNDHALFGRTLSNRDIYNLAGAPAHASVTLSHSSECGCLLKMEVRAPEIEAKKISIHGTKGELFIHHGDFIIDPKAPAGFGTRAMAVQVQAARRLGFNHIQLLAEGAKGLYKQGYQVWPKMGFDADLKTEHMLLLPSYLKHAKSVLDLYAHGREGKRFWIEYGSTCLMGIELQGNSRGLEVFRAYLDQKEIRIAV